MPKGRRRGGRGAGRELGQGEGDGGEERQGDLEQGGAEWGSGGDQGRAVSGSRGAAALAIGGGVCRPDGGKPCVGGDGRTVAIGALVRPLIEAQARREPEDESRRHP